MSKNIFEMFKRTGVGNAMEIFGDLFFNINWVPRKPKPGLKPSLAHFKPFVGSSIGIQLHICAPKARNSTTLDHCTLVLWFSRKYSLVTKVLTSTLVVREFSNSYKG